ncbi:MAG: lytic transglycosylase [Chloroflexi bacterium OLB15]|nr:MAG: lytic transglycosylase [Chloroflexi bacterium OLB15]
MRLIYRPLSLAVFALVLLAFPIIPAYGQDDSTPPSPEMLLLSAERYLLNGFYESAVQTFRMVVDAGDSVPAEQRAAALFGLGQAALREGFFADSVNALTIFLDQYPNDARAGQARFLRGDAYMGMSMWEQAIADFRGYMDVRPGMLDSYALERIADALIALNRQDEAMTMYQRAADTGRSNVPLLALRERVAQVYIANQRYDDALSQYEAILSVAQNAPYRAYIDFTAAQTLLMAEDYEKGYARLTQIAGTYPDRPEAYQAMQILDANNVPLDNLLRGRIAFNYGDFELALEALNAYSTERPVTSVPAEVHLLMGQAYREIGNTAAALTAFQTIIDQYPTDSLFGQALLEQGRTRFIANDISGAIEHYLAMATNFDYLGEAPEALWRAGYLYATNGQSAEARAIFERLADTYPDSTQAIDGLFLAATEAVNNGDTAAAERYYAELGVKTTGEQQAQALLQLGRLAQARGDGQMAATALQQATSAAPDSYFAARARDIMEGTAPFARPSNVQFFFDDAALIADAENWLRTTFNITQEGALWPLSPTIEQDPRLVRGRELWMVAAYDEARAEFDDLLTQFQNDPLASFQLAIYLRGIAAYQDSIVAAANVINASGVGTVNAPPYIARMRYPVYYLDVVQDITTRYGVDPLLMYSLIRHESLFDAYATAAAGERGLTQVIPSTAEYIASELGIPNFQHSSLSRPYMSVEFGTFYLDEQLDLFGGNVTAALAAYNAGPGRALQWQSIAGDDHDLFLTTISINSTRLYVQRIYTFYNIYRTLYGV